MPSAGRPPSSTPRSSPRPSPATWSGFRSRQPPGEPGFPSIDNFLHRRQAISVRLPAALYLKYRLLKDFSFGTRSALRDCAVRSPFGPRKGEIPRPGGASRHCMNGREQKGGIDRFCAVTRRALRTCHKPLGSDSREEVYMSNERAAARNSQSGFTLLELMVVLAIIVVLAASLVPSFHNHMQAARVAAT